MKFSAILVAFATLTDFAAGKMTSDQRCSACLYTYQAIDDEVRNQTSLHKNKKLAEQKEAASQILSSICDSPAFEGIGISATGRYIKADDYSSVDSAAHHSEDVAQVCRRLIKQNMKRLVPPLADFRTQSRLDLSRKLCSKWTDSCTFDPIPRRKQKTKISKANKCLVDALGKAVAGDFDGALEKVDCAVVEIPEESEDASDSEDTSTSDEIEEEASDQSESSDADSSENEE